MTPSNPPPTPMNESPAAEPPPSRGGGPQTENGKKAVAQNATTHGINSISPVAGGENPEEWEAFLTGMRDYLKPEGTLQDELVNSMAIDLWRKRRVIRREVGYIASRHEALPDNSRSRAPEWVGRGHENWWEDRCASVQDGMSILSTLETIDQDTKFDADGVAHLVDVIYSFACPELDQDVRDRLAQGAGSTAGSLVDWITSVADVKKSTFVEVAAEALCGATDFLVEEEQRKEAVEKARIWQERDAVLPQPQHQETLIRYEAHLNRSFARTLDQLELLQRIRSGELPPAPVRLKVAVD